MNVLLLFKNNNPPAGKLGVRFRDVSFTYVQTEDIKSEMFSFHL